MRYVVVRGNLICWAIRKHVAPLRGDECGQRIEARTSALLVGSIPWISLVVVYEIRRVAELGNCLCRSATARWRKRMFLYALRAFLMLRYAVGGCRTHSELLVIVTAAFSSCDWRRADLLTRSRRCHARCERISTGHTGWISDGVSVRQDILRALAHGDFGPSFKQRDFSVTELIARAFRERRPGTHCNRVWR